MNKYEAMLIVKPDLSEDERKVVFAQINDAVTKLQGEVVSGAVWSEKRKLYFPLKKYHEGVYYLLNFTLPAEVVQDLRTAYKLNESILRVLVSRAA